MFECSCLTNYSSSYNSSTFELITNWSFLASEGSDWAKVSSEVSDWPSSMVPPSSNGSGDGSGQKLESVLERLGFSEYLPLFQVY